MTALDAVTLDDLCHTLGLRPPVGVPVARPMPTGLNDEQLTALNVLAHPEAIAVVTHVPAPTPLDVRHAVTFVIATRGAWVAEHVIEGDAHHLFARDAVNAPTLLLDRVGVGSYMSDTPSIDVTVGAYQRMTELLREGDRRRAEAALLAEGASPSSADGLIDAVRAGAVEVTGLANDGRRYVGCALSLAGDTVGGHWHVPPASSASLNLRTLIEPADPEDLLDDLALIFGVA